MAVIYVYVDGSDNHAVETQLLTEFTTLADEWSALGANVVNDRDNGTPDLRGEDLPDWFIGLNIPAASLSPTAARRLIHFIKGLSEQTGREFVVGLGAPSGVSEDLFFLGRDAGDQQLAQLLSIAVPQEP
ncbi:hypothetical protein [Lysobacter auxotrophicus]|uniref:Uncharacterized protein n=1 Tax=Lysobacter auxotrophicus TaxID=2992573 RepID=A0ABN6UJU1_9GAMM|nr:hypothetical protein [Lysobacter auxotrophicus]BDU16514.1 hypothetical protein LA521A_17150 [Lysobacter auxotrophicus]